MTQPQYTGWKAGDWKATCERCGHIFRASQIRKEWTGHRVCHGPGTNDCWDAKHPQLDIKAVPDKQSVPWASPEPTDNVLHGYNADYYDFETNTETSTPTLPSALVAIAGEAIVGISVAGYNPTFADDIPVPSGSFDISDTIGS